MSDKMATKPEANCEACGEAARVRVLEGYAGGEPSFRLYCLTCVESATVREPKTPPESGRERLGLASLMIVAGLGLGMVAVFADGLGLEGSAGFGRMQTLGASIGAILILIGALARVDLLAMFGTALFGLCLIVDVVRIGSSPGIGNKQVAAIVIAIGLMISGVWLRRRHRGNKRTPVRVAGPAQSGSVS
ncbi:MAG: hypothetical protein IID33_14995 [Planctomycetes bacterium]|nr:hypothetical protein [Planctomycetota bacterium]